MSRSGFFDSALDDDIDRKQTGERFERDKRGCWRKDNDQDNKGM